ncbi:hypothetical protein [Aurantibacter sp.]|uniref:hypothetical protein n=1 Tax=Aurantibacter sp. TaxID=2807103 RepID=UPI003264F667
MSNKIKSSLYLSCFIAVFTIYNFSITENNSNETAEIAIAELNQMPTPNYLTNEDLK